MSTFTIDGIVVFRNGDTITKVGQVELRAIFRDGEGSLNYSVLSTSPDDLPEVDIGGDDPLGVVVAGDDVPGGIATLPDDTIDYLGYIDTSEGRHILMSFEILGDGSDDDVDLIFPIGGDPLTFPTTVAEFNALDSSITGIGQITSGPYAPDTDIPVSGFLNVTETSNNQVIGDDGDNVLTGTAGNDDVIGLGGNDTLDGGAGDDYINPTMEGAPGEWDTIIGSTGDDVLDLSMVNNSSGLVWLDYSGLSGPVTLDLDGAENTASVDKGGDGTDTIIGIANPLDAGWTLGALSVVGTSAGDTFNLHVGAEQWMELQPGDGVDVFDFSGPGLQRIDFRDATNGIEVDLSANTIVDDGFGNTETFAGNLPWAIRGSFHDDVFTGSDANDRYRKAGGDDTLDGGGGTDRITYDSSGIADLRVDLASGTATGTVDGTAFTDTLISFEHVRGTGGDDWLAGDNTGGFNQLTGRGGADTFVPGSGTTRIDDFIPGSSTLDVGRLGVSVADAKAALGSASFDGFASTVNLPDGSTLQFSGLNATQVASIDPVSAAAAVDGILIEGTPGDDNIDPSAEGSTGGWDTIVGSTGDDVIDLSTVSNSNGLVTLEYGGLAGPITVDLDGAANTASVGKGSDGTDTIIGIANPLDAGWTLGGLIINGTAAADTYTLNVADEQWMELRPGDGQDQIDLSGAGLVRLDFRGADNGIDVDLRSNTINDDGYGNTETITGNTPWGIHGTEHDDVYRGSDDPSAFTSFRKVGGNDTLDGGAAGGRVRYETSGISDLHVDLAAGTATGTIDGVAFTDSISNFRQVRGSAGNDRITGDSESTRLEGRGGDDTIAGGLGDDWITFGGGANTYVYSGGNDIITDFRAGVDSIVIDIPGLTQAEIDTAFANSTFFADPGFDRQIVGLIPGESIGFVGLSEADVASLTPVIADSDGTLFEGTPGTDIFNGTAGDDTAIGNGGNDQFNLGAGDDTAFVGEGSAFIRAGSGDDTYHFTDIVEGYAQIEYGHLTDPALLSSGLTVDIDGAANTGTIVKGGLGTDTLVDVENPLNAGATVGGLGIGGSLGDDAFNLSTTEDQWMQVRPTGGDNTINIESGNVRIDYADGLPAAVDVDLVSGTITRSDGGGTSTDTITGAKGAWEIQGTNLADTILGSNRDESFILNGGDDTLDGGDGFDRLRYDRANYNGGVDADLEAGTVTGTAIVDGVNEAFTHTISNIEHLRGTNDNDRIAGDMNDNRLEGRGGDDAFILVGGNDTVDGGDGFDQVFFGVTEDEATVTSEGEGNHTVVIGSDTIMLTSIEDLIFEESGLTPPAPSGAAPAWTLGDPHLLTLDGVGYDFHAVGEYVLLRGQSGESVNGFEIQSRMTPAKDEEGADLDNVSVNQAIGMRAANGDAVMIDSNDADPLSVNGTVQTLADGDFLDVGADRIYRAGDTYTMVFAGSDDTLNDGDTQVAVKVLDGRVDLSVRISDELAGRVEGLLGDGDGNKANDVALADGTVLERPLAFEDLYGDYRDDWRVDDEADSLFTYDTGESLAGFYDPTKPGSVTTIDDFDPADQEAAREAAEDAGLTPGTVNYDNAVLDFLLTGDPGFVESSASEDVAAPETSSVAPTLDVGESRATLQFTVTDRAGDGIDDALVGFSTGASTARSLADDMGSGDYSLRIGDGVGGRASASKPLSADDSALVGAGDALDILRIAVGLEPGFGPAQDLDFVAGDLNRDGEVTANDALDALRHAVGLETDNAPQWVFLDTDNLPSGLATDNVAYTTGVDIGVVSDGLDVSLTGVLLGNMQDFA